DFARHAKLDAGMLEVRREAHEFFRVLALLEVRGPEHVALRHPGVDAGPCPVRSGCDARSAVRRSYRPRAVVDHDVTAGRSRGNLPRVLVDDAVDEPKRKM